MATDAPENGSHGSDDVSVRQAREDLFAVERQLKAAERPGHDGQDRLARMLHVIEQINAELDVERVLQVAGRQVIDIFEAERAFVVQTDGDGQAWFRLAVTLQGRPIAHPENEVSQAVTREVARERRPVLVADATADPRFADVSSVRSLQLHSVMAAPLLAQGELLGVIYVDNRLLSGAFDQQALSLLGILANHIGIALRNAKLFGDLSAARAELALSERLKAIGELAAFVAHQIKNPLCSIGILAEALQERWQDPGFRDQLSETVPREVARLREMVDDILQYARPTPLIKVPLDLSELVVSALRSLLPEVQRLGVTVSEQYGRELPTVLVDGQKLREAFVNLIKNALEAMGGQSTRELRLSVRRTARGHQEVVIEDTGLGIPPAELDAVFEPFRSSKKSGTGLGLALCQKVVREHGGHIVAENVESGGARFRISLPVRGA